ncbi:MAG: polyphosphate kinase 1 [Ignavibacteria bacterium]|nr:polyphosphate kinase 1 [Ignavibacteria bacterium]
MPTKKSSQKHEKIQSPKKQVDLFDEDLYLNRELQWLEFNRRVLEEAQDHTHPLFERLRFLSIFNTNLDEFFMIRVAGLKEQLDSELSVSSPDGLQPAEQLKEIRHRLLPLLELHANELLNVVMPELRAEGIHIHTHAELSGEEQRAMEHEFVDNIMPVLTPLALDLGHPFPRLHNRSLNIAFILIDHHEEEHETKIAVMQLPSALPRLLKLQRNGGYHYIPLEEIIRANAPLLFPGLKLKESHMFRVTRDADVEIADDEANDLITAVTEGISHRRWGTDAVRLEINSGMPRFLLSTLLTSLELTQHDVYVKAIPFNLPDFLQLMKIEKKRLKFPPFTSHIVSEFASESGNIFDALKESDILVHHPFDSFTNSVVKFIKQGADDPQVLAIKITLYRAGGWSPVIEALKRAAGKGKSVTAFVELMARFDEETNIAWARELERAGVHVVYGVMGLKVHCKVCLIIRKEGSELLTYAHVGTGNYNLATSRAYTDIGIFTGRQEFERDFMHLFNVLTGYSRHEKWQHISVAPLNLQNSLIKLIQREADIVKNGGKGRIVAKMNALSDPVLIRELYAASMAGVKIDLIVRGVCTLRPGVPKISENITVRSILDRFLEHSRVLMFQNGGAKDVFISSADFMTRNMIRRVELMFPIVEKKIKRRLVDVLELYLQDNVKARVLKESGEYVRVSSGKSPVCAQSILLHGRK